MSRVRLDGEGTIRERSDGRWEARVRLPDGRRKSLFGKTPEEANRKRLDTLGLIRKGLTVPDDRLTVAQFLDTWLKTHRATVRDSTAAGYESVIRLHLKPRIGKIRLARLTPRDVQTMLIDLGDAGLAPRTIQLCRTVLRAALQKGVEWGDIPRNVADVTQGPRVERSPITPWDADECGRFLAGIQGDRLEALYVCALSLGMRQGELLGLRWTDVDLNTGELRVLQARQRRTGEFTEPKSRQSRRVLPLPAVTIASLREHRDRQFDEKKTMEELWNESGLVFTTTRGTPLDGVNVGRYFQRHVARIGVRRIRFHDLRHSAATLLISQGVTLREIMEFLGHSQISLTAETYTHVLPALKRDAADQMDAALGAVKKASGGQIGGHLRLVPKS